MSADKGKDRQLGRRVLVAGGGAAVVAGAVAVVAGPQATVSWAAPIIKNAVGSPSRAASPDYPRSYLRPGEAALGATTEFVVTLPDEWEVYFSEDMHVDFYSPSVKFTITPAAGWVLDSQDAHSYDFVPVNPGATSIFYITSSELIGDPLPLGDGPDPDDPDAPVELGYQIKAFAQHWRGIFGWAYLKVDPPA